MAPKKTPSELHFLKIVVPLLTSKTIFLYAFFLEKPTTFYGNKGII